MAIPNFEKLDLKKLNSFSVTVTSPIYKVISFLNAIKDYKILTFLIFLRLINYQNFAKHGLNPEIKLFSIF